MEALRGRRVVFEQYDLGDVRMVDGLADFGVAKAAWFKDSEGKPLRVDGGPQRTLTSEPLQGLLRV
jgi:hypothetical protein